MNALASDPRFGAVVLAVARGRRHGGGIVGLLIVLVIIAVVVVLLMQRRRDRKPIDETRPMPNVPQAPREQPAAALSATLEEASVLRGSEVAAPGLPRATRSLPSGRYGLSGVLKSEWTKLRSVRSTMWTLGITVVVGIGISALVTWQTRSHWSTVSQQTFDPAQTSLVGLFIGQFAIGVLGALVLSAEYGTGTIRATFSAAPRRPMVLGAKALVFGVVALVVSEVVAFVAFFLGQALLSAPAMHATLSTPGALRQVVGSGIYIAVLGLFALGLAAIIRHTAGAICAYLGIILMLPIILQFLPTSIQFDVRRFLPDRIGSEMISATGDPHLFSPWIGLLVLCGYAAAVLIIGAVMLVRRDA